MIFGLDKDQVKKLNEWKEGRNKLLYEDASGGRWTYSFTPTSLGIIFKVTDNLITENNELDLTDYDIW